jgi:hypothetical protein
MKQQYGSDVTKNADAEPLTGDGGMVQREGESSRF